MTVIDATKHVAPINMQVGQIFKSGCVYIMKCEEGNRTFYLDLVLGRVLKSELDIYKLCPIYDGALHVKNIL